MKAERGIRAALGVGAEKSMCSSLNLTLPASPSSPQRTWLSPRHGRRQVSGSARFGAAHFSSWPKDPQLTHT